VSEKSGTFLDMANAIRVKHPDYPLPKREIPKWLLWLVGSMVNKLLSRKFVSRNIGYDWRADNSKSRGKLGIEYASTDKAIVEMFEANAISRP